MLNESKIKFGHDSFVPTGNDCETLDEKGEKMIQDEKGGSVVLNIPSKSLESHSVISSGLSMCKHVVLRVSHKALETIPRFSFKVVVPRTSSLSCKTKASTICCAASSYR